MKKHFEFSIINIDKPSGPTSFTVSDFVKKALGLRKTSHFGTLDPKVTGVLPIALNRACKLTGHFLGHDKEYVGIMRFHEPVELKKVKESIKKKFTGIITQLPPVKSRVKRAERQREIKKFEILEVDENKQDFVFKTVVQGGTYIRKLVHDLGEALGIGAHMLELRRTRAGIFKEAKSITLYELETAIKEDKLKDLIISGEEVIKKIFPVVEIKKESVDRILHGQPIYDKNLKKDYKFEKDTVIVVFSNKQFIGIFKVINAVKIFAKSEFTFQI
ncbi:MAG: RNA-guided pseudouridylation complex pseudouridine synthase subunit Cbf5 [Nanoarchaeota archaeon]|nr:RNA-guided pseudouridylation complex pseudouridine synthase subunit Cbf5 [Nanoarchaeota archaeon]MBU1028403.1 RNA-guided pseudouridylation complex pseudouridine synthase subunit Cbf5 [Nanoarchaeota archaeon]